MLLPAFFGDRRFGVTAPEFQLHPHYREQTQLDASILKLNPFIDTFVTEQHYEKLAPILTGWTRSLLESPSELESIEQALSTRFVGSAWRAEERKSLRSESSEVSLEKLRFSKQTTTAAANFVRDMKVALGSLSKIITADFQITKIEDSPAGISSWIKYELVGQGDDFFREQRIGSWLLNWEGTQNGFEVTSWAMNDEIRCRAKERIFVEITSAAFGSNVSYKEQLLHGADYWRTMLDSASGIDVYGHNGISTGDIDQDGYDDVYICQPAGLPNRLYRNRRDGTFEDITEYSGVGLLDNTACALFADFRNSGKQDLLVVRSSGPLLFLNQGSGKFSLKPNAFAFASPPQGTFTGVSAADYDRDGRLDIYFCLYTYYQGADQYKYPTPYFAAENGPPNFLMHNNGDGTFRDVTTESGMNKNNTRYSFCSGWCDYNNDGWPDLYVVNDFGRKNLYRNKGDGTFIDVAEKLGVEDVGAGMSASWCDYDNDGQQDLYVANMWTAAGERISNDKAFQANAPSAIKDLYQKHAMGNSFFRNDGSGFADNTNSSHTAVGRWAWSSDAWDFDHDGHSDVYVANGMISGPIHDDMNSFFWRQVVAKSPNKFVSDGDYEQGWNAVNEMIRSDYSWSGYERNVLFANMGDGTFADVAGAIGLDFLEDCRAFALSDFDGDGRQELFVKNRNAPQIRLMKNTFSALPPAISFRLTGIKSNRDAIGAKITIATSLGKQTKELQAGSGFLSQHSKELHFGLGQAKGSISATIQWPSGLVQVLNNLAPGHRVSVTEGAVHQSESFTALQASPIKIQPQPTDAIPTNFGTWMLTPILAPRFPANSLSGKVTIVSFHATANRAYRGNWPDDCPPLFEADTQDSRNQDISAVYNLLYRYLFDRHRDLPLPASFLINENGEIVKIYHGLLTPEEVRNDLNRMTRTQKERLASALPFSGVSSTYEFGRNYLSLGSIFFQRGYPEHAETYFRSALNQDAASAEAAYGLGSVYLKQGQNQLAQANFERAVRFTAAYPETTPNAWNNLGLLAIREGNTSKAIVYFQQAIEVDPNHFIALENLGNAYKQVKQWPEARASLERALSIKPEDAEANYSMGMIFAQLDDTTKAFDYLTKALKARPNYPEALNNLAILYLKTHRVDDAIGTFQQCIEVAPAFGQAYLNLSRIYVIQGSTAKARAVLNDLLKIQPNDAAAKQALAQLQ